MGLTTLVKKSAVCGLQSAVNLQKSLLVIILSVFRLLSIFGRTYQPLPRANLSLLPGLEQKEWLPSLFELNLNTCEVLKSGACLTEFGKLAFFF